jgi:hypothetical protein
MNYDRVRVLLPTSLHAFGIINEAQKFRQLLAAISRTSSHGFTPTFRRARLFVAIQKISVS